MTSAQYLEHYLDGEINTTIRYATLLCLLFCHLFRCFSFLCLSDNRTFSNIWYLCAGLEHLPVELQRNFTLMRELDTRAQNLMKSIDEKADDFMKTLVKDKDTVPEEERKDKLKTIQDMFNRAKEYGDDKVQLAIQTYELVDKHIRRLDSDLARFEGEIQDKTLPQVVAKPEEPVTKRKPNLLLPCRALLIRLFP